MAQPPADPATGDPPIFIVGLPRSGTTLVASVLSRHENIDCGPETFYFARLPEDPAVLLRRGRWPDVAVDYVCGLRLRDAPVHELFGRTRDDVRSYLAARQPSLGAGLESLTAARAVARGKRRWAEKTPRHLGRLRLIRATYPDAAIVRVVRDPRDAARSMTRVPFASDSLIANLYLCARADAAAAPFLARDRNTLTVRYEDLVTAPERETRRIIEFLGEPFDPRMLDTSAESSELAAAHEWWKGKEAEPLDERRVAAWRREMAVEDGRIASVVCADMIRAHGYEGALDPRAVVAMAPDAMAFVTAHEDEARRLALAGTVLRSPGSRAASRATSRGTGPLVFWPLPAPDQWGLGRGVRSKGRALARMAVVPLGRRLRGDRAVVIRPPNHAGRRGDLATRLADLTLRVLARASTPDAWLSSLAPHPDPTAPQPDPSPPLPPEELR